jgi:hypothetical protein
VLLLSPLASFGQGCAMCYSSAAAARSSLIAGLRSGILILLFPPLAICVGVGLVAYRRRNRFNVETNELDESWLENDDFAHTSSD